MKPHELIELICTSAGITAHEFNIKSRKPEYYIPRHVCFYFLNKHCRMLDYEIAEIFHIKAPDNIRYVFRKIKHKQQLKFRTDEQQQLIDLINEINEKIC